MSVLGGVFPQASYPYYSQSAPSYNAYQQVGVTKVDGAEEAMSRFLIKYGNQLVPGFTSEPLFDVNGAQFYTLSVEPDGRRNLETFDFQQHVDLPPAPPIEMVSRAEFEELASKVDKLIGGGDGIQGPVQAGAVAAQ